MLSFSFITNSAEDSPFPSLLLVVVGKFRTTSVAIGTSIAAVAVFDMNLRERRWLGF